MDIRPGGGLSLEKYSNINPTHSMTTIHLIPGFGEKCNLARYKKLTGDLSNKGYVVNCINPDWYKPLSTHVFPIKKDDIVIGFSFGAVIAYLITHKYPCKKVILASISPIHTFKYRETVKEFSSFMTPQQAKDIVTDLKSIKINFDKLTTPHIVLIGELEKLEKGEYPDLIVPKTKHFMSDKYIGCIVKILS